jgi:hypothetical protein
MTPRQDHREVACAAFLLLGGAKTERRKQMGNAVEEVGRTVRIALRSWHHTARLALLLVATATAEAAFIAVQHLPLITW